MSTVPSKLRSVVSMGLKVEHGLERGARGERFGSEYCLACQVSNAGCLTHLCVKGRWKTLAGVEKKEKDDLCSEEVKAITRPATAATLRSWTAPCTGALPTGTVGASARRTTFGESRVPVKWQKQCT